METDRPYSVNHLATALKQARDKKGLSQRTLGELTGIPQSHISKIESGAVNVRVSSLIQLARALDLELMLVPRKTIPAVESVVRSTSGTSPQANYATQKAWKDMLDNLSKVADADIQRLAREFMRLRSPVADRYTLRALTKRIDAILTHDDTDRVRRLLIDLERLRDDAHEPMNLDESPRARPAYSLEGSDNGE